MYCAATYVAGFKSLALFVGCFAVIASMYGGGFATIPAYLADMFGTQFVGAIHGRLLTAWSTAGILGPVVVNYMREYQLGLGIPREQVYNQTMYILVGMLVVGLICNLLVRPLDNKWFMTDAEVAEEKRLAHEKAAASEMVRGSEAGADSVSSLTVTLAWAAVGIPLAWGVYRTLQSVAKFFA
jgi:MFS family permease